VVRLVMAMLAMVGSRAVPVACGAVIIGLRITDVRPHRIPVGVIIKVPRITIVTAWKSKTESFNSASDEHLCVRTLCRDQCQSAYHYCDEKKFFHR